MAKLNIYAFADEADGQIDGQIKALQRNHLQGLEIRSADGQNISEISAEKARKIRKKLDDAGLVTWSLGSPMGKIGIDDAFAPHLDALKRTLDNGNILGCRNIRLFSFYLPAGCHPSDYKEKVIDRVGRMCEISLAYGIDPCHENEKGIFGDNAVRCAELLTALPSLQGVFDPANFIQCGQETLSAWRLLRSRIKYLHIKDADCRGHVLPAGQGVGNLPAIVSEYLADGGEAVSLEPHLFRFIGFSQLEQGNQKSGIGGLAFGDGHAAFDAACRAFRKII